MARAARAAVNPQALKKGSRQIDPFAGCAVRLRRATWIRGMRSARDDRDLLSLYRGNDHQRREKYKHSGDALALAVAHLHGKFLH
jgi:hypothetical protein